MPGRRWTAGALGASDAPGPVHEDAGDDRRVGDDGHDAHQRGTLRAREGLDLVDAPQQLCPAVARGPQGPVHRIRDRDGLLDIGASGRLAPAPPPGPAGVPAVVARHHLTRIGDVGEEPGEELERVQGLGAGRGPVGPVGAIGELLSPRGSRRPRGARGTRARATPPRRVGRAACARCRRGWPGAGGDPRQRRAARETPWSLRGSPP